MIVRFMQGSVVCGQDLHLLVEISSYRALFIPSYGAVTVPRNALAINRKERDGSLLSEDTSAVFAQGTNVQLFSVARKKDAFCRQTC
ncbi:hypothetical protein VU05_05310 [Desulfobulbus sp. F1]|nr:hypothetical protein [Desulfobulbus sp. F1]